MIKCIIKSIFEETLDNNKVDVYPDTIVTICQIRPHYVLPPWWIAHICSSLLELNMSMPWSTPSQ